MRSLKIVLRRPAPDAPALSIQSKAERNQKPQYAALLSIECF
jgi:hypothetical protein